MSNKLFKRCYDLACDLAIFDEYYSQRHFSFLCIRNKIICSGVNNSFKTTTLSSKFNYRFHNIHSELACIKNCPVHWRELPNLTMVNVRLNRDMKPMMAKPCKICIQMLDYFEVGEVYYSTNLGTWEQFV